MLLLVFFSHHLDDENADVSDGLLGVTTRNDLLDYLFLRELQSYLEVSDRRYIAKFSKC